MRTAVTSLMRSLGHVAHGFSSAEEFLRCCRADEVGCLVTDVQMPGMSGIELHEHLLAAGRRLPTIFITAYPDDRVRDRALAAGALGFFSKPFAADELIRCIDAALKDPLSA